jgi:probable F420-dependent oxidoreductase
VGLGISGFPFSGPRAYFRWVELLEGSGVDSLWQTDRLVSERPFLEAMSAMASLCGITERIKFGMNAVVTSFRDPLVLAKQCATIDYLSGGRLLPVFGIGGARAPEFDATGRERAARGARADEMLALMRRLWSEERVDFEGQHFRYRGCSIAPRPAQKTLPCWIGGHSAAAIRRTASVGTGWLAGLRTPAQVAEIVPRIHAELRATGRSIAADHYGAGIACRFGDWDDVVERRASATRPFAPAGFDPAQYFAVGDASAVVARCRQYVEAGVYKLVLMPMAHGDDAMIEHTRRLIDEVIPQVEVDLPDAD